MALLSARLLASFSFSMACVAASSSTCRSSTFSCAPADAFSRLFALSSSSVRANVSAWVVSSSWLRSEDLSLVACSASSLAPFSCCSKSLTWLRAFSSALVRASVSPASSCSASVRCSRSTCNAFLDSESIADCMLVNCSSSCSTCARADSSLARSVFPS